MRVADLVGRGDLMRNGVADDVEPAPAAGQMHPALAVPALRVLPHEQVVGPGLVGRLEMIVGPAEMRLAAVAELAFGPLAAIEAGDSGCK